MLPSLVFNISLKGIAPSLINSILPLTLIIVEGIYDNDTPSITALILLSKTFITSLLLIQGGSP